MNTPRKGIVYIYRHQLVSFADTPHEATCHVTKHALPSVALAEITLLKLNLVK